jgi:hypothetical protein
VQGRKQALPRLERRGAVNYPPKPGLGKGNGEGVTTPNVKNRTIENFYHSFGAAKGCKGLNFALPKTPGMPTNGYIQDTGLSRTSEPPSAVLSR